MCRSSLLLFVFSVSVVPAVKAEDRVTAEPAWALRKPVRPVLPSVKNAGWERNPIDRFILAKLEEAKLEPGPEADRVQIIRRLSFDLTGLPPTPEEVDSFVRDPSADAYDRLVDRLLESPRYGERWAMFWLDLVRFAESDGFKADDIRSHAWRYRDYVIKSLNQDSPFDRFVREQIAGDELYADDPEALIATAFNRHFPDEHNARNLEQRRQEILNDMTDTLGSVFLGLTFGCARCHDHKYDPITQEDYYRLQAFYAAYLARDDLPVGTRAQLAKRQSALGQWQARTQPLRERLAAMEEPYRRTIVAGNKLHYPKAIQDAFDTPAEERTPYQKQLADLVGKQLRVNRDQMAKTMKPQTRKEWLALNEEIAQFDKLKPPAIATTLALTDIGPVAPPTHLLKRGNWQRRGKRLEPGFPAVLDQRSPRIEAPAGAKTTGRRAALARWLTQPDNPLTARVLVNRLWQHHFGRGIVGTPSDFGKMGDKPTHPELLDWLAREFVASGWSMKAMHRLMVTSATYRQSTEWRAGAARADPENRLLWRMNRRRLEGETLRDAMLAVSGRLNLKAGGPSVFPELPEELAVPRGGWPVSADARERDRRSVFVFVKRNLRYPFFGEFDAPDTNETCARRHISTTAPQALMLFNGKFANDMARAFAERVSQEAGVQPSKFVERAYGLALGRPPDEREFGLATAFLQHAEPADFCHVILNLNEFAHVE